MFIKRPSRYTVRDQDGLCLWERGLESEVIERLRALTSLPSWSDVAQVRQENRRHWRTEFGDGELLCEEFMDEVAKCLLLEVREGEKILEIGAGSGRLSHFLREKTGLPIVAIDNNRAWIPVCHPVERFEVRAAYEKFKPQVLITSWPPEDMPWLPLPESVRLVVVIGEAAECGQREVWSAPDGFIVTTLFSAEQFQQSVSPRSKVVLIKKN